jgi:hypothetical protein
VTDRFRRSPRSYTTTLTDTPTFFESLPERLALDIAVSHLESAGTGPALVIPNSPVGVTESLARFTSAVIIATSDKSLERFAAKTIESRVNIHPDAVVMPTVVGTKLRFRSVEKVLWLWPTQDTFDANSAFIERYVAAAATIAVIGAGPLDRWRLAMSRPSPFSRKRPADPFMVGRRLGFAEEEAWRLLGLRSAVCAPLRIAAMKLGRLDAADRLEAAYRLRLIEARMPRLWAIGVSIGRRSTTTRP